MRVAFMLVLCIGSSVAMAEAQTGRQGQAPRLPLELLPDTLAICRLDASAPLPAWTEASSESAVPAGVACQRGYRAFRVRGPLPLDLIGILASIADPLAAVGVSIFAISTYDTDYVLVKEGDLDVAVGALKRAGHQVTR